MTRRRYRYDNESKALVEVGEDYVGGEGAGTKLGPVTDLYMDGVRATDGTDIGSRRKRRQYMQANDLADTSDFAGHWQRAAREREAVARGESRAQRAGIRAAVVDTLERMKRR